VEAGEMRMTSFWPDVRVLELGEAELRAFGDPEGFFRNLNTPADLEDASTATGASTPPDRRLQLKGR
jgi:hypothetical protein